MARKSTMPSGDDIRKIEELAGYGLTIAQISAVLGFSERSLFNHRELNPEIDAALKRGKAKAAAKVGRALFHRAVDGDVPAIRWWEMTREGRSERSQTESTIEVRTDAETEARMAAIMARFAGIDPQTHMGDVDARAARDRDVDVGSMGEE